MDTHAFRSFLLSTCGVALALSAGCASAETLYRLTHLGTLGGSATVATDLNALGQVTGFVEFEEPQGHAFLWDGTAMKDLGALGLYSSIGRAINNSGQVVGFAYDDDDESPDYHAFRWDGNTMQDIGTLGGWITRATAINASGQVTGNSAPAGQVQPHAFLLNGNTMQDLGTLGGIRSEGRAINALGQVTGNASLSDNSISHAFLWDGSKMQDLGTLGGPTSQGNAINASGQVTGISDTDGGNFSEQHAFLWNGSAMQDLGTLGGPHSSGSAINAAGQVTGSSTLADNSTHAFLWNGTSMLDLGTLGGTDSVGNAINAVGQVTGYSSVTGGGNSHAFLSNGGQMVDLNDLIDPADPLKRHVTLLKGVDINRRGQIAANGVDSRTFQQLAYLATPMEYTVRFIAPTSGSQWKQNTTVPIKVALVDTKGDRITDARAASLVATPCRVKFSASGSQSRSPVCMKYDATANEFYFNWKIGAMATGSTTIKGAATYKFSMPELITTARLRTISIVP